MKNLGEAAIVVAHPDDEVLWFSSLVRQVRTIVICYGADPDNGERAEQRRKAVQALPFDSVIHLDLPEPGRWRGRKLGSAENELLRSAQEDPALLCVLAAPLRDALVGVSTVFVHNPWGEYGHDDHRRVNLVVNSLRRELLFDVFVSSYVERDALSLMQATLEVGIVEVVSFPVDSDVACAILEIYKANACWTWFDDWVWPKDESFLRLGPGEAMRPSPAQFQLFSM